MKVDAIYAYYPSIFYSKTKSVKYNPSAKSEKIAERYEPTTYDSTGKLCYRQNKSQFLDLKI